MKRYTVPTSGTDINNTVEVESLLRILMSKLATLDYPDIPPPWNAAAGMVRYLNDRYGGTGNDTTKSDPSQWLADYHHEIQGKVSPGWAKESVVMLETLRSAIPLHGIS